MDLLNVSGDVLPDLDPGVVGSETASPLSNLDKVAGLLFLALSAVAVWPSILWREVRWSTATTSYTDIVLTPGNLCY